MANIGSLAFPAVSVHSIRMAASPSQTVLLLDQVGYSVSGLRGNLYDAGDASLVMTVHVMHLHRAGECVIQCVIQRVGRWQGIQVAIRISAVAAGRYVRLSKRRITTIWQTLQK